jgi:copper chaperone CopZ
MADTIQLAVTGMTCGGCERAVTRALQQLPGVQAVEASHQDERVRVTYDTAQVDEAALRARIEAAGYQVIAR